jgi:transposase
MNQEETAMRFSTHQHQFYGGLDLHAHSLDVCVLGHDGNILLHRNMQAAPDPFLKAVAPDRDGLVVVVAVEGPFTWYGLADLCAEESLPVVLGHALSMQALHGSKAKNDTIDSQELATFLRGDMLPKADVSPAQMRATRALLRRRTPLRRQRSALLSQVHNTTSQYNWPEIGKKITSKANREGVAERFEEAAVPKTIEVDLSLIPSDDALLKALERFRSKTAKPHDANTVDLLQTVPGIGKVFSLVLLDAIHRIDHFPSVQEGASSCRVGKGSQESGGKRVGSSGKKSGNAHLKWALSAAATRCLRSPPRARSF